MKAEDVDLFCVFIFIFFLILIFLIFFFYSDVVWMKTVTGVLGLYTADVLCTIRDCNIRSWFRWSFGK